MLLTPRLLVLVSLSLTTLLAGCGGGRTDVPGDTVATPTLAPAEGNPFAAGAPFADPDSRAARALAQAEQNGDTESARVYTRLAETSAGIWLTPEEYPPGKVAAKVGSVAAEAAAAGQVPTFVVYGIPDRDCTGGFSAGGLPAAQYGPWVQEIATAAAGAVAVVEPDALASALECDRRDQRVRLIRDAVDRLRSAGVTTYVDGGHSHWIDPVALAGLLREVGVESVRGFAANVSNYQTDEDERAFADELSGLLGGVHYVIDSGRNGRGSIDEWCNPPGRAFGRDPEVVDDGSGLDAYLWVKPPGESDGECQGGPAAGEFWPERTLEMAAASGW
ncbi:glycoside hydrolase family 6 protein [Nocardioides sp.]|uniref:glycoside hydrolase family 6 protein n=1 Tax=Nocardioides sp. TaxID=35761 RepID=UPI00286B0CDB|nr:glycoside hydrolase family 6 protein [Nocardioides sp.]